MALTRGHRTLLLLIGASAAEGDIQAGVALLEASGASKSASGASSVRYGDGATLNDIDASGGSSIQRR